MKEETSNQREISIALNNAISAALRPTRIGPIPEARLKKLHAVAKALIAPAQELLEPDKYGEGVLEPEELVAVLAVAALYVQLQNVMRTAKIPFAGLSKEVFDEV